MPCGDISERLELSLDADDRVVAFSLRKRSCGAGVGDLVMLEPLVQGRTADELLELHLSDLVDRASQKAIFEFLLSKQLDALQLALAVYLGHAAGGAGDRFALSRVEYDDAQTLIVGSLSVEAKAEMVSPCGGCSSR